VLTVIEDRWTLFPVKLTLAGTEASDSGVYVYYTACSVHKTSCPFKFNENSCKLKNYAAM